MKKRTATIVFSLAALIVITSGAPADSAQSFKTSALPSSLDNFYPPRAQGPVYLMAMHGISTPMSGMVTDLLEGDLANAQANFEKFKQEYIKVSKMVPEWESQFPIAPVDQLGTALASGDQGRVMGALESIGRSCESCHLDNLPAAYYKYHWGDFAAISASDPVTKQDMPFANFMQMIESDMTGIGNDLEQQQPEGARAHAQGFAARMNALKETCDGCHNSERAYFVDPKVMGMIDELQTAVQQGQSDPNAIGQLMQGIGMESCFKCHLVHIPAAYSKRGISSRADD